MAGGEVLVVGGGVATEAALVGALCLSEVDEHVVLGRVEGATGLRVAVWRGGIRDGNGGTEVPGDEALDRDPDVGICGGAEEAGTGGLPVRLEVVAIGRIEAAGDIVVLLRD